jgi:hypothetical protein
MNMLDLIDHMTGSDTVSFSEPDFYALDGRCEDDKSVICPYIDLLPEESGSEKGSPLKF